MKSVRSCPVCNSNEASLFASEYIKADSFSSKLYASRKNPEFMRQRLVRCNSCDLVYAPSPPSTEQLHNSYAQAAYDSDAEAWSASKTYSHYLHLNLPALMPKNVAVDIGTGNGSLLHYLKEEHKFSTVYGIEPSQAAVDSAALPLRSLINVSSFSHDSIDPNSASLVCSFMTLEHVQDPAQTIYDVYKALEEHGVVALVVHNWKAPLNRILGLKSPIIDIEHNQLFSKSSLLELLRRGGFSDIKIFTIKNKYAVGYWLKLMPLPNIVKKTIRKVLDISGISNIAVSVDVGNIMAIATKSNTSPFAQ